MIILLAKKEEAAKIAEIHKKEIKKGFLSSLKLSFLTKLYRAIINSRFSFCIVAKEKGKVIGFVAGATNLDKLYLYFLRRYFFHSAFTLLPKAFSFQNLKKIFETLFLPHRGRKLPKAELLTIAIEKKFQRKGIGSKLLKKFVSEMKNRDMYQFKVIVGQNLKPAIKFYEKNGFEFLRKISIHRNQPSRVYIYQIK